MVVAVDADDSAIDFAADAEAVVAACLFVPEIEVDDELDVKEDDRDDTPLPDDELLLPVTVTPDVVVVLFLTGSEDSGLPLVLLVDPFKVLFAAPDVAGVVTATASRECVLLLLPLLLLLMLLLAPALWISTGPAGAAFRSGRRLFLLVPRIWLILRSSLESSLGAQERKESVTRSSSSSSTPAVQRSLAVTSGIMSSSSSTIPVMTSSMPSSSQGRMIVVDETSSFICWSCCGSCACCCCCWWR